MGQREGTELGSLILSDMIISLYRNRVYTISAHVADVPQESSGKCYSMIYIYILYLVLYMVYPVLGGSPHVDPEATSVPYLRLGAPGGERTAEAAAL